MGLDTRHRAGIGGGSNGFVQTHRFCELMCTHWIQSGFMVGFLWCTYYRLLIIRWKNVIFNANLSQRHTIHLLFSYARNPRECKSTLYLSSSCVQRSYTHVLVIIIDVVDVSVVVFGRFISADLSNESNNICYTFLTLCQRQIITIYKHTNSLSVHIAGESQKLLRATTTTAVMAATTAMTTTSDRAKEITNDVN